MKYFIRGIILFTVPLIIVFYTLPLVFIIGSKYQKLVAGNEIYISINKSKQKKKSKKLIMGDSVGNQLFPNTKNNDSIVSLACNQAIGMVGQYLLLKNYLDAGNKIDSVFMIFEPYTFRNNLDQIYTFHYFLKPFSTAEYRSEFTETVKKQIDKIPYTFLSRQPFILTTNWAPKYENDAYGKTFLSQITIEYLNKIKVLSKEHGFKVLLLPVPTSIEKKAILDKYNKKEIAENGLSDMFELYLGNMEYLDADIFLDGTHFKDPDKYREMYKKKWIR